ncbi:MULTISPECIES: N-formylglutamate amidohydrolase [Cupriavidus]
MAARDIRSTSARRCPGRGCAAARITRRGAVGCRASGRRHAGRRVYIDSDRLPDDLDPALLDGIWPEPLTSDEKTRLGYGLIWRDLDAATPLHDRKPSLQEVRSRIDSYYRPVGHGEGNACPRLGAVWRGSLHSMPNDAYERLQIRAAGHWLTSCSATVKTSPASRPSWRWWQTNCGRWATRWPAMIHARACD